MQLIDASNPYFSGLDKVEPFFLDLDGDRSPDIFTVVNGTRYLIEYEKYVEPTP
jgi:hypothetical protein